MSFFSSLSSSIATNVEAEPYNEQNVVSNQDFEMTPTQVDWIYRYTHQIQEHLSCSCGIPVSLIAIRPGAYLTQENAPTEFPFDYSAKIQMKNRSTTLSTIISLPQSLLLEILAQAKGAPLNDALDFGCLEANFSDVKDNEAIVLMAFQRYSISLGQSLHQACQRIHETKFTGLTCDILSAKESVNCFSALSKQPLVFSLIFEMASKFFVIRLGLIVE